MLRAIITTQEKQITIAKISVRLMGSLKRHLASMLAQNELVCIIMSTIVNGTKVKAKLSSAKPKCPVNTLAAIFFFNC